MENLKNFISNILENLKKNTNTALENKENISILLGKTPIVSQPPKRLDDEINQEYLLLEQMGEDEDGNDIYHIEIDKLTENFDGNYISNTSQFNSDLTRIFVRNSGNYNKSKNELECLYYGNFNNSLENPQELSQINDLRQNMLRNNGILSIQVINFIRYYKEIGGKIEDLKIKLDIYNNINVGNIDENEISEIITSHLLYQLREKYERVDFDILCQCYIAFKDVNTITFS